MNENRGQVICLRTGAYVTAAAILSSAGNSDDALSAIQTAERLSPQIWSEAAIQLQTGIVQLATGDSPGALLRFRAAETSSDSRIANTARWYSGVTHLKLGQTDEADSYICGKRGPAFPDQEMATPVTGNALHDLQLARTSKDCQARVSKIQPDFRMLQNGDMLVMDRERLPSKHDRIS